MSWTIVIPSHHRSDSIKYNTLKVLDYYNIPYEKIKIFVAPEEVPAYKKSIPHIEIIPSALGCIENRAFIRAYYPEDTELVYMDDDIQKISSVCDFTEHHADCHIFKKENHKEDFYKKQQVLPNLSRFLTVAFFTIRDHGAHFGGIYPIGNGFFASHNFTTDLRYICGGMYFEINVHDFALQGLQYSEDFERSCKWWLRDGKVIRFSSVMLHTPYYKGSGGLVETRTVELSKKAQETLQLMYPTLLKVIPPTKNNKYWNLSIIKQKKPKIDVFSL